MSPGCRCGSPTGSKRATWLEAETCPSSPPGESSSRSANMEMFLSRLMASLSQQMPCLQCSAGAPWIPATTILMLQESTALTCPGKPLFCMLVESVARAERY